MPELEHRVLAAKYSMGVVTMPTSITFTPTLASPRISAALSARPAQAAIAPHSHRFFPLAQRHRAKSPAQRLSHRLVDVSRHNAADVIGLENGNR
jgi:hypothetical protein